MDQNPTQFQNDSSLVDSLRDGNRDAADAILQKYWNALHRFCATYLGDEALAEDVTQETFAKLSDGRELPTGDLRPWLYKVARNRCLDILRKHQRSPTFNRPIRTGFDAAGQSAGPRTKVVANERQELMRQVLSSMPEEYRSVLMLKHVEGLSRGEIAEALGVSEPTIKGRLVRASEYLREAVHNHTGSIS